MTDIALSEQALEELIEQAQQGDRHSANELFKHCLPFIKKEAQYTFKEKSPEVVQKTLMKIWRFLDTYENTSEGSFTGWASTIARREGFNYLTKRKRDKANGKHALSFEDTVQPTYSAPVPSSDLDDFRTIYEAVTRQAGITDHHAESLWLVKVRGYTYEEAACMLDVPLGTMRSTMNRVRKKLSEDPLAIQKLTEYITS